MGATPAAIIIGAGPAGLAVAASLAARGSAGVLLEQSDHVGHAWHHHYRRLHLHTARNHSALPRLPMPETFPTYPAREQVVEYLDGYARHFQLAPRFNVSVQRIERDGQGWSVSWDGGAERAAHVVVATGYNREPVVPDWPGRADFGGQVLHSSKYLDAKPFEGKRVMVVGAGNSGAEIALDLAENGATVALCIRNPINVIPRDLLGIPAQTIGVKLSAGPLWLKDTMMRVSSRLTFGDLRPYGIRRSETGPATQIVRDGTIPLIDIGTVAAIKRGAIKVVPGIERFTATGVRCVDGSEVPLDAVVLATGYRTGLRGLLAGDALASLDETGRPLHPGAATTVPGLHFVGFKNPLTGFLRQIALDAEAVAQAIAPQNARG